VWTCPRVTEVIRQTFGVTYHPAHVWRLVRSLIGSRQKSKPRERDAAALQRQRTRTWPRRKKRVTA